VQEPVAKELTLLKAASLSAKALFTLVAPLFSESVST